MRKLVILGTGFAMATKCFNTCFFLEMEDGSLFLTDAGGGNGILRQLEVTNFDYNKCHHMFVTHGHTDHVLGVVWIIRKVADLMNKGKFEGKFHIYCHDVVKDMLEKMSAMTLKKKDFARVGTDIILQEVVYQEAQQTVSYELVSTSGPDHDKTFTFNVLVTGKVMGTGTGRSKKEAEQKAARQALEKLTNKK